MHIPSFKHGSVHMWQGQGFASLETIAGLHVQECEGLFFHWSLGGLLCIRSLEGPSEAASCCGEWFKHGRLLLHGAFLPMHSHERASPTPPFPSCSRMGTPPAVGGVTNLQGAMQQSLAACPEWGPNAAGTVE